MHLVAWKSDGLEVTDFFNKLPILLVKAIVQPENDKGNRKKQKSS